MLQPVECFIIAWCSIRFLLLFLVLRICLYTSLSSPRNNAQCWQYENLQPSNNRGNQKTKISHDPPNNEAKTAHSRMPPLYAIEVGVTKSRKSRPSESNTDTERKTNWANVSYRSSMDQTSTSSSFDLFRHTVVTRFRHCFIVFMDSLWCTHRIEKKKETPIATTSQPKRPACKKGEKAPP